MTKLSHYLFLCIVLWGVISCQNDLGLAGNEQIAILESATPRATLTHTSTSTPSATSTSTAMPTLTPSPTNTATPQPTSTRRPTIIPITTLIPTLPPATPEAQPAAYQLKGWAEQDALNLVSEMRTRIEPIDWDSDIGYASEIDNFQFSQRPIELAAYEAALRFPNSTSVEKVRWERLLATALLGPTKNNPNEQIEELLEEGLNTGAYHPAAWVRRYDLYDFTILPVAEVNNLLGDGRIIPIYKIQTIISEGSDGLYFALDALEDNNFDVIPIVSFWYEGNGFWEGNPNIADHTGDGVPELAISVRFQSGTICTTTVLVLQWQENKFVNLAKQPDGQGINLPICWDEWRFLPPEENGTQPIQLHLFHFLSNEATTWIDQVYIWDQSHYVLRDSTILPISDEDPFDWIDYNIGIGEWETAVQAIEDLLNRWDTAPLPNVDPSYPDFLRFQQGWLYAVNSQPDNGRAALQQLIEDPVNPITPTLSLAAQTFLDLYQTDLEAYQACAAAQRLMLDALDRPSIYSANYLEAWGYSGSYHFPCDLSAAWRVLLEQATAMELDDAIVLLEDHGVQIIDKRFIDLDQSGPNEALITIKSPDSLRDYTQATWVIFQTDSGLRFVRLGFDVTSTTRWETAVPQSSAKPLHFIQDDDSLHIIQFNIQEDGITIQQFFRSELFYNVKSFALNKQYDEPLVTVDFSTASFGFRQLVLRWNPTLEDFEIVETDVPYYLGTSRYDLVEWAKVMMFEEERFEDVATMLSYYLANYEVEMSEVRYLLALAYELSGQEQRAVETYWKLWHDFPESSFAVMARRKLVPAKS